MGSASFMKGLRYGLHYPAAKFRFLQTFCVDQSGLHRNSFGINASMSGLGIIAVVVPIIDEVLVPIIEPELEPIIVDVSDAPPPIASPLSAAAANPRASKPRSLA